MRMLTTEQKQDEDPLTNTFSDHQKKDVLQFVKSSKVATYLLKDCTFIS